MFVTSLLWIFGLSLKVCMAFQAPRFFVDVRRSGAMEMLVGTPLTVKEILDGQWAVLRRTFLWPSLLFVGTEWLAVFVFQGNMPRAMPFGIPRIFYMGSFSILNPRLFGGAGWLFLSH